jgi:murein DD-endopeptidase MepM/ murein hydrolase activator NlpD
MLSFFGYQYSYLRVLWVVNAILFATYISLIPGPQFFRSSVLDYRHIRHSAFDGFSLPIVSIPNWSLPGMTDKTLRYENIAISNFLPLPPYEPLTLTDERNTIGRQTYIVLYMGSYRGNYAENDGSHIGVDIRAPFGTPVRAIANGVVTKAVDTDGSIGRYVSLRHDGVQI